MKYPIYSHKIKTRYAETDKMGFIHHSVYLVYLEEARTMLWEYLNYPYYKMEEEGYFVVVLSAYLDFRKPCFYGDILRIDITNIDYKGVRFFYEYTIFNETKNYLSTFAKTEHAIINRNGKLIRIPESIYEVFTRKLSFYGIT
ncbi:MAG: thioesterase family protein [candidate division WOR-3 bacterium]